MKFYCLILLAVLAATSSCSKDDDGPSAGNLIVGKWIMDEVNSSYKDTWDFYVFRKDGTVSAGEYKATPLEVFNTQSGYYKVDSSKGPDDDGYYFVFLSQSPTEGPFYRMKYDNKNLTIIIHSSDSYTSYRRISEWRETGYPAHIINQMPE